MRQTLNNDYGEEGGAGGLFKPWIFRQYKLFQDESPYQIETRPLICNANQWTGFYIIGTTVRNS